MIVVGVFLFLLSIALLFVAVSRLLEAEKLRENAYETMSQIVRLKIEVKASEAKAKAYYESGRALLQEQELLLKEQLFKQLNIDKGSPLP